jgi:putative AbiEi antitoxin of type IV toxin-antitoxin system
MPAALTPECLRLLDSQDGVIAVGQAVAAGMSAKSVRDQVRAGRWQAMHRGVYAAFTGRPGRRAELWGVLLRLGPDAVLSHQSAAELWGLLNGVSPVIHVLVRHGSSPDRYGKFAGVVIHQSRSLERARHPALTPPRTRVEETVLDLVDCARSFDEAYDWICRAIGRRRTTAARIHAALETRPRIRWRKEIELALGYAHGGALSVLELRYMRGVERRHGLPAATRQARIRHAAGNRYLDNLYVEYRACVEIDGTAAHPEDEQWRDKRRDRWNAAHEGIDTIRIGVPDLINQERQCRTAADVASWLSSRGPRVGRPCGPECPVGLLDAVSTKYGR